MSTSRFAARLARLEAQIQQEIDHLWDRLPDSELEAMANGDPAALARFRQAIYAVGSRLRSHHAPGCFSPERLYRRGEDLENERARQPAAVATVHASGEANPCNGRKDLEEARPRT